MRETFNLDLKSDSSLVAKKARSRGGKPVKTGKAQEPMVQKYKAKESDVVCHHYKSVGRIAHNWPKRTYRLCGGGHEPKQCPNPSSSVPSTNADGDRGGSNSSRMVSFWFQGKVVELGASKKKRMMSESVPVQNVESGRGSNFSLKLGNEFSNGTEENASRLFIADSGSTLYAVKSKIGMTSYD